MADLAKFIGIGWMLAVERARKGEPEELAAFIRRGNPPDETTRAAIADLLEHPVKAKRPTRVPRFPVHEAEQLRQIFAALTSDIPADPEVPGSKPHRAMTRTEACRRIADKLSDETDPDDDVFETIRDVVERKKAYRFPPDEADRIRRAMQRITDNGYSEAQAVKDLAESKGVSVKTIRNVLERKGGYGER